MAPIETHVAHCGACTGLMVLLSDLDGIWFVCLECGEETAPRRTLAEADNDVVWVDLPQSVRNEQLRRQPSGQCR